MRAGACGVATNFRPHFSQAPGPKPLTARAISARSSEQVGNAGRCVWGGDQPPSAFLTSARTEATDRSRHLRPQQESVLRAVRALGGVRLDVSCSEGRQAALAGDGTSPMVRIRDERAERALPEAGPGEIGLAESRCFHGVGESVRREPLFDRSIRPRSASSGTELRCGQRSRSAFRVSRRSAVTQCRNILLFTDVLYHIRLDEPIAERAGPGPHPAAWSAPAAGPRCSGIPRECLRRMQRRGLVERIGRGLYILAGSEVSEHHSLAVAAKSVPGATVCLLSALPIRLSPRVCRP